jgi:hypothetical protein
MTHRWRSLADAQWLDFTKTSMQEYAEAKRQTLLQANTEGLASRLLPAYDIDTLDLGSVLPQVRAYSD